MCKMHFPKGLYALFQKGREGYFNIDICYQHSRFLEPRDLNFGWFYSEACNKPCHLFMYFAQVMIRIYFSKFKSIGNSILDHIFGAIQYENLSDARHLRELCLRKLMDICIR